MPDIVTVTKGSLPAARSWCEYSVMAFLHSEGLGIGKNCSFLVNVLAKYNWIRCVLEVDALSNDNLVLGGIVIWSCLKVAVSKVDSVWLFRAQHCKGLLGCLGLVGKGAVVA